MFFDRSHVHEGMTVFSSDGERLGKVVSCDASVFIVEKGLFFHKDYIARYEDVRSVVGAEISLAMPKDVFQDLRIGAEKPPPEKRSMLGTEDGAFQPGSFPPARAGTPEKGPHIGE